MPGEVVKLPPRAQWGPAMQALPTDKQRLFVCAMLETGGRSMTEAARIAGYGSDDGHPNALRVSASRLAHDADILAAMDEESAKRLRSNRILAVSTLEHIIKSGMKDSDRLKAIEMLLNRTGLHAMSEHKVVTSDTSRSDEELVKRLRHLAKESGMPENELLRQAGYIDADFTVVEPAPQITAPEDEDW